MDTLRLGMKRVDMCQRQSSDNLTQLLSHVHLVNVSLNKFVTIDLDDN